MNSNDKAGFCFVATGEKYVLEAVQAAEFVRKNNPGRPICLVTNSTDVSGVWDDVVPLPNPAFNFRDKIAMVLCPYGRFLYLDTDTMVVANLDEIFELLRNFDMVGCQLFEGHDYDLEEIPHSFPEFCGGVLGFRRSAKVSAFFEQWMTAYDRFRGENNENFYHPANASDQKSLRYSIYFSDLRHSVLPTEFNFIPHNVASACMAVRIFHDRPIQALQALAPRMNAKLGIRAYLPMLDAVVGNETTNQELIRAWMGVTVQLIRRVFAVLLPKRIKDYLRGMRIVRRKVLAVPFEQNDPSAGKKWQ